MEKSIIMKPMENNMKETLEEAAEEFYSEQSKAYEDEIEPMFDISRYLVAGFIDGAKWQQEELENELNRFFLYLRNSGEHFIGVPNEQFVKKYLEGK